MGRRAKKGDVLAKIGGDNRKRKTGKGATVVGGFPRMPPGMSSRAKARWESIRDSGAASHIGSGDAGMLRTHCETWSAVLGLQKWSRDNPDLHYHTADSGYVSLHAAITRLDKLEKELRAQANELGLTPQGRGKLGVPTVAPAKEDDTGGVGASPRTAAGR